MYFPTDSMGLNQIAIQISNKNFTYLLMSATTCILFTLVAYLLVILKQIYTSKIMFQGRGFTAADENFLKLLRGFAAELADLFDPLARLTEQFASSEVDLGTVEKTSLSQAPQDLPMDVMISTFVDPVVDSNLHVYTPGFVTLISDICRFLLL